MQRALLLMLALVLTVLPAVEAAAHGAHGYHRPPPLPASTVPAAPEAELPAAPAEGLPAAAPDGGAQAADGLQLGAAGVEPGAEAAGPLGPVEAAGHDHDHAAEEEQDRVLFDGQGARRGGLVDAVWSTLRYPGVVRRVDELLDRTLPSEKRVEAAKKLLQLRRPETAPALAVASRDRDPAVAKAAGEALRLLAPRRDVNGYRPPIDDFESARRPVHLAALKRVVAISAVFTLIEAVGSWFTGSVSLQADSMHLAADLMITVGTLYAAAAAQRPPHAGNTYGSLKLEPFIGLVSAVLIAAMGAFAGYEALGRLLHPAAVPAVQTMLLALSGLTSNALSTAILYRFRGDSLSLKGAFLHAATDALGSIGIIVAGALILAFGWLWADPVITFAIVALIARTTWDLGKSSWSVLMDAVPEDIDLEEIERELLMIPGVTKVADVHVWALNSMDRAATVRLRGVPGDKTIQAAKAVFARWRVRHATVEVSLSAS